MRKNIAIVLAGGIGSRLGLSTPKQFFKVAGKMVVEHTIDAFESIYCMLDYHFARYFKKLLGSGQT